MKVLISLLAISSCLAASEPSTTAPTTTTTETSTATEVIKDKKEDEEETMKTGDEVEEESGETSKNKRTIERTLGYGYNDITGTGRLLRQSDGKFRSYFSQAPSQQPQAYNQIRYYSTLRNANPSDYTSRQQQADHRPYNNAASPSSPAPPVAPAAPTFTRYQSNDIDTGSVYYTKPNYQQIHQYRGAAASNNAGTHLATHNVPLFTGPPAHAPAFYSGQSLSHSPFATASSHNINPYLSAANIHGNPLLYQHPGASGLALLQAPGHFGPQVIPVIILRVNSDANSNHVFQQGGASQSYLPGGLHGLNLQSLLYPVQVPQQQQAVYSEPPQAPQGVQLLYQEEPQATKYAQAPETSSQVVQQKVVYSTVTQKKPFAPTPAPQTTSQKLRKNIVVLSDTPVQQNDNSYSQYNKFSYKEKA
ncbi:hypothetical protein C0J52_25876 [Blattella germanica]|nr:hypothetical protein C0J52_25876 [Blattella germanica]